MIFGRKAHQEVLDLIDEFTKTIGTAVEQFAKLVDAYLDGKADLNKHSLRVHELESNADTTRFKIERKMLKGAFLPAYRSDYIDLLETLDRVANKAEDAADTIFLTRPEVPEEIREDLKKITRLTQQAYELVPEIINRVFQEDYGVKSTVKEIGKIETEIDAIQFRLLRHVWHDMEIDKVDKVILRRCIDEISHVSDYIENVGDRLSIIAIKHRMA